MQFGRIEFVSICFRNATLIFRATNRWCLSFGMSLLGLLILGLSFWEISISVNALRLHLSDLMHK
jgi:hypothetical protein